MPNFLEPFLKPGARVIDSHVHIWSEQDIPIVVEEARRLGIHGICVSCLADWDWSVSKNHGAGNALVFRAADKHPEMHGYVYVDPRDKEKTIEQIERYIGHPAMIGIKLWISCPVNDPCVHPVAEKASDEGLIMLVHSWRRGSHLVKGYQSLPCQVAELASSYPKVRFIMGHMGGDWENGVCEVADAGNVLVDTCGTINEAGMVETAVEVLGAKRIVFGSDAPGSAYLPNLGKIISAKIDNRDKVRILSENMAELLARRNDHRC